MRPPGVKLFDCMWPRKGPKPDLFPEMEPAEVNELKSYGVSSGLILS